MLSLHPEFRHVNPSLRFGYLQRREKIMKYYADMESINVSTQCSAHCGFRTDSNQHGQFLSVFYFDETGEPHSWYHIEYQLCIVCASIFVTNSRQKSYKSLIISMLQLNKLGYNAILRPVCAHRIPTKLFVRSFSSVKRLCQPK